MGSFALPAVILHYNGTTWATDPVSGTLTQSALNAVWGSGASDVWAVGSQGVILHYNGTAWAADGKSGTVTQNSLLGVWGSGPQDVWASGGGGTILHYKN